MVIYTSIVITICLLVVALAWPADSGPSDENDLIQTQQGSIVYPEDINRGDKKNNPTENENNNEDINSGEEENDESNEDDKSGISQQNESYYLVKYLDGYVRVFFVNNQGKMVELEKTGIVFDVLNPTDQKLFTNGIKAGSQEELSTLLQDFEG